MGTAKRQQHTETSVLFLPGVFNETLSLLFNAHRYFQDQGPDEVSVFTDAQYDFYLQEMRQVTHRLTSVMAWIMARRAVYAGALRPDQAEMFYRLDGREWYSPQTSPMLCEMPYYFSHISQQSRQLYERAMRLDQMGSDSAANINTY